MVLQARYTDVKSSDRANKRLGLSIVGKGLLLVAIPLIFELILSSMLLLVHENSSHLITTMEHTRKLSDTANSILLDLHEIANWNNDSVPSYRVLNDYLERLHEKIGKLDELTFDNQEQAKIVSHTHMGYEGLRQLLRQLPSDGKIPFHYEVVFDGHRQDFLDMRRRFIHLAASPELLQLINDQQQLETRQSLQLKKYRDLAKALLIAGLVISSMISLAFAWFIGNSWKNRFFRLKENAARLASGTEFVPQSGGTDEIASLEQALHLVQKRLVKTRHREHTIIKNAVDVVCSIDEHGRFVAVSAAVSKVLGYQVDELLGKEMLSIVNECDREICSKSIRDLFNGSPAQSFEIICVTKDGRQLDSRWSLKADPSMQSLICMVHDITEQKNVERMRAEHLAAITKNFSTPLATISQLLESLGNKKNCRLSIEGAKLVEAANVSSKRMLALINDLRDIEKIKTNSESLILAPCFLLSILEHARKSVSPIAQARKIAINILPADFIVDASSERLEQVFVNLLSNALKFSNENDEITVESQLSENDSSKLEVQVIDRGCGMRQDVCSDIFEPYFQIISATRPRLGSTGLGLAICKAIIEKHSGSIIARSEVGAGSSFIVTLPVSTKKIASREML